MSKWADWMKDGNELGELVQWLYDNDKLDNDPGEMVKTICYVLQKPWKYSDEYAEMRGAQKGEA